MTTIDSIILGENEDVAEADKDVRTWLDSVVKLLLSLVAEMTPRLGKTLKIKNKKKMWLLIKEKMVEKGYELTAAQIENKYRGLERNFKKTGRNRETCPYEKELSDLLGQSDQIFPSMLLGSKTTEILTRDSQEDGKASASTSNEVSVDIPETPQRTPLLKVGKNDAILKEIKFMREEKAKFLENVLEMLQQSAERKYALMRERNDLLKMLIATKNHGKTYLIILILII